MRYISRLFTYLLWKVDTDWVSLTLLLGLLCDCTTKRWTYWRCKLRCCITADSWLSGCLCLQCFTGSGVAWQSATREWRNSTRSSTAASRKSDSSSATTTDEHISVRMSHSYYAWKANWKEYLSWPQWGLCKRSIVLSHCSIKNDDDDDDPRFRMVSVSMILSDL